MRAYWAFGENRGAHNRYTPSTEGGKGMAIGMTHTQMSPALLSGKMPEFATFSYLLKFSVEAVGATVAQLYTVR